MVFRHGRDLEVAGVDTEVEMRMETADFIQLSRCGVDEIHINVSSTSSHDPTRLRIEWTTVQIEPIIAFPYHAQML